MRDHFVHLRLHTEYSLSDGLLVIPELFQKATNFAMPALAVTDLANLYAAVKFYQKAFETGIKPIIGVDIWVMNEAALNSPHRLTLLCQNNLGYKNLLKLVSASYLHGQHAGLPQVKKEWLQEYSAGLIALMGAESELGQALISQDTLSMNACREFFCSHFEQRFYIEITRVGKPQEQLYLSSALELATKQGIPVVATNDVRFLEKDDFEAHEARVCIQQGCMLNDPSRQRIYTEQQYFRSTEEMQRLFADVPQALANTVEIAKRCNVTFTLGKSKLPHCSVPDGYSTEAYLSEVAAQGLEERLRNVFAKNEKAAVKRDEYIERLQRELQVINGMGFAGYFLIVADFTKWAKENAIPVGPGRGSGPGSLVAYALKITDLDPIDLELLFERFLNPERVSMPDFDIDFCMDGRDRVIEYVMQKHGQESVAQIITYGTMAARAVVRDVGRVLGYTYGFVDKIAKLIPFELGITLNKALAQEPLLRERYEQEEDVRTLIELAKKLEGITRNVGTHAGGIVIAPGKLTDFVPLYCESSEAAAHAITQFDKDDVESVGLVKFDFLGLKTLTIIDRALQLINHNRKQMNLSDIDIGLIPLNDPDTFQLLKTCKTTAIFQLESHGMRDLIKRLQPDVFEDLIALVALFRPGPLQSGMVDDFINRKHGRAKVVYPHPQLEPILRPTYGVILYQEQVMQIAQVLAGYTLGAADILRRAMGKKKPEEMAKQREIFCKGAVERNVSAEVANYIFDLMEKFAGYGFNKSHSASYALIAYQTAWLKAHYPAAFMAAVLSSDMDRTEKILLFLEDCRNLGLKISPPDINTSEFAFKMIDDKHLMYGLGAIKGVGQSAIESIITARQGQPFSDLFAFCMRVDMRKVNRRVLEALIKSGSFDSFGQTRASLMASLNIALQQAEQDLHNRMYGQCDLLGAAAETTFKPKYMKMPEWHQELRLQGEKETLGFYLTGHPLNRYINELKKFTTSKIAEIHSNTHQNVRIAGIISKFRTRQTKRGDKIATFTLDDDTGQIEVVCFSDIFQKHRSLMNEDNLIILEGEVSFDDFNQSARIVGRELFNIDEARARYGKCLQIHFTSTTDFDLETFKKLITPHLGGACPIILRYQREKIQADIRLGKQWLLKPSDVLFNTILNQLSINHVELIY